VRRVVGDIELVIIYASNYNWKVIIPTNDLWEAIDILCPIDYIPVFVIIFVIDVYLKIDLDLIKI